MFNMPVGCLGGWLKTAPYLLFVRSHELQVDFNP
jgi:hypothetical protein